MFHHKKSTITYPTNCTLKQVLAYALAIKKKTPPTTNSTALKWDVTCTKSSTPLIMNEISQSQLTVFYQLFSSRNTCEKVPHRRLCSGKSLHSEPSAAFCECGDGRTAALRFFKSNVQEKLQESSSLETELSVMITNVVFSAPLIVHLAYKGAEKHCQDIKNMQVVCWCVEESHTNNVLFSFAISRQLSSSSSSRPTGLRSCSRSDLRRHHSSEHELTWHLSGWKASFFYEMCFLHLDSTECSSLVLVKTRPHCSSGGGSPTWCTCTTWLFLPLSVPPGLHNWTVKGFKNIPH